MKCKHDALWYIGVGFKTCLLCGYKKEIEK